MNNSDFFIERMCTIVYTQERENVVVNVKEKSLYQFDIRCPCCKRKLMTINLSQYKKPTVSIFSKDSAGIHNTETRCYVCKSYVGVDI